MTADHQYGRADSSRVHVSFVCLHPQNGIVGVAVSDVQAEVEEHHENCRGGHRKRSVVHFKFESQQLESFVARPVSVRRFVRHFSENENV